MVQSNHADERSEQENRVTIKQAVIRSVIPTATFTFVALNLFTVTVIAANNSSNASNASNASAGSGSWSGVFCQTAVLGNLVSITAQLVIVLAILFAILTFALGSLVEAAPMIGQEGVSRAKRMQSSAMAGGAKAFGIPAVLLAALRAAGVGLPGCVNIMPF